MTVSFCGILLLFGVNFLVYLWTSNQRTAAVEDLDRALTREAVLASLHQDLDNVTKEVRLLSQVKMDEGAQGPSPEEQREFSQRLELTKAKFAELQRHSESASRREIDQFAWTFSELAESWKRFYQYLGVEQTKAVTELAIRGDPLSDRVMTELLPAVQKVVAEQARNAKDAFRTKSQQADQISFFLFLLSLGVASIIAVVSLHTTG